MREQSRSKTGIASLPHVKLSPLSAPGPTGERQEHLDAIVSFAGAGQRRRLFRGLEILTIKWATGDLREECRFLLNTQLMFLKKEKTRPRSSSTTTSRSARLRKRMKSTDVPEDRVTCDQQDALSEGEIAAFTTSLRQIGVGTPGGAEALAIFHQLLYDEWMTGSLSGPLARIKVDEKNCFGMIEWKAVRETASRLLSKHTAAAAWKHRNLSHVEQEGLPSMPKDRGAEHGDVDGSLEPRGKRRAPSLGLA